MAGDAERVSVQGSRRFPTFTVFVQICVLPARSGALQVVPAPTPMSNSSLTEAVPSLAVTFTATVSTSAACGVPAKVRVERR